MLPDSNHPVLLFDGVCNLCNGFVQFIIRHDKRGSFRFASLQSGTGQQVLEHIRQKSPVPDSLILLYRGQYYMQSAAVLKTARLLGLPFSLLTIGYILPAFIRNRIYNYVSRNRYRWYGRRESCMVPTPELQSRFID